MFTLMPAHVADRTPFMKKIIIIFAVIVFAGIAAWFVVSKTVSAQSAPADYLGQAQQILSNLPTSTTFAIGTANGSVEINNFYLWNPDVISGATVILEQTPNYAIVYDTLNSDFWLAITGTPFTTYQPMAEQEFLKVLEVSESAACNLNVTSGILYDASNTLSGQSFPLSFCGGAY